MVCKVCGVCSIALRDQASLCTIVPLDDLFSRWRRSKDRSACPSSRARFRSRDCESQLLLFLLLLPLHTLPQSVLTCSHIGRQLEPWFWGFPQAPRFCRRCSTVPNTRGRLQPVLMRHPPPAIGQNLGGGGGGWGGSWGGGSWGGGVAWRGGFPRWGGLHATHNNHMHTSRGDVCLVGLGKLLVAVVKQGLQIGRCVHSGCGDLHFATTAFV